MNKINEQEVETELDEYVYDPSVEEEIFYTAHSPEEITPKVQELYEVFLKSFEYTNLDGKVAEIDVVELGQAYAAKTGIDPRDLSDYQYLILNLNKTDEADFIKYEEQLNTYLAEHQDGQFKVFDLSEMSELYYDYLKELLGRSADNYCYDICRNCFYFA